MVTSNNIFMRSSLQDDRFIDLIAIDNSLTLKTCQYTYTFELTPVGGSVSSGAQPGNSNFNGMLLMGNSIPNHPDKWHFYITMLTFL